MRGSQKLTEVLWPKLKLSVVVDFRMSSTAQFADYILMYSALGGTTDQLDVAKDMPDETIDGANSRSYMYAWIMSGK